MRVTGHGPRGPSCDALAPLCLFPLCGRVFLVGVHSFYPVRRGTQHRGCRYIFFIHFLSFDLCYVFIQEFF